MLEVKGLSAFYGDVQVLWDVGLEVREGEIVSVIGPNGAGKSTLLKAIMGLVRPRGSNGPAVLFKGEPLDGMTPENIVRKGVTLVPEGARVFPEMSCLDNLKLGAYSVADRHRHDRLLENVFQLFPRLEERRSQKASTLSGGERQMLAMGRALMSEPEFLLLDEPSLGLHPLMVSALFEAIKAVNERGLTVLLVEQKVTFALECSTRAYVLENGRVVLTGSGPELMGDEHVCKAYLAM
ncbi:MAG: ABC transporter ATP-binding protein [Proteobacteria bacterium]|nr:ABC transporter ATP-binding protein [Pseudomonadota bacterium]